MKYVSGMAIANALKNRGWWLLVTIMLAGPVHAIETFSLSVAELGKSNWKMEGLHLELKSIGRGEQAVSLKIDQVDLSQTVRDVKLVNIGCPKLTLAPRRWVCKRGSAHIRSIFLDRPEVSFSFAVSKDSGVLGVEEIYFAGGRSNIELSFDPEIWRLKLDSKGLRLASLQQRFARSFATKAGGRLDLKGSISGANNEPERFDLTAEVRDGMIQTEIGDIAGEGVFLKVRSQGGRNRDADWIISAGLDFSQGAVYFEPVYLEAGDRPLSYFGEFSWRDQSRVVTVDKFNASHPGVFSLRARGEVRAEKPYSFDRLSINLESRDLNKLQSIYLQPFAEETDFETLAVSGNLNAATEISENQIQSLRAMVGDLEVEDSEGRLGIENADAQVAWINSAETSLSRVTFDRAEIYNVPLGPAALVIESDNKRIGFRPDQRIPVLEGALQIKEFEVQNFLNDLPEISFDAALQQLSLSKLSEVFGWQPLSGEVSGVIPGVSFRAGRLILDGSINISVFDGALSIEDLVVSGLFSELPSLTANVSINDLDLDRLTRHFSFGGIEGRLEGRVNKLYLEDWKPVAFDAWFGTPKADDSRHRISQKALQSLTSIGGGSAADIFSRGFLRFFDAFSYERLGIGCRLKNGVCRLRGVDPAKQGYYIVKGGSLPRIDVIGYNQRVDWNVLLRRLRRVTQADNAVVE